MLKRVNRGFASYGGKVIEEFVKGLAAFQIVEQRLKGNPRTAKYWGATQYVAVADDHIVDGWDVHGHSLGTGLSPVNEAERGGSFVLSKLAPAGVSAAPVSKPTF